MANIIPSHTVEYSNQRILTTEQLAKAYGVNPVRIIQNFNRNKNRFTLEKHYFVLEGEKLKSFASTYQIDIQTHTRNLYLWTEKGAFLHAKSLNSDEAWDVYEQLVDDYYRQQAHIALIEKVNADLVAERVNIVPPRLLDEIEVIAARYRNKYSNEDTERLCTLMQTVQDSHNKLNKQIIALRNNTPPTLLS